MYGPYVNIIKNVADNNYMLVIDKKKTKIGTYKLYVTIDIKDKSLKYGAS